MTELSAALQSITDPRGPQAALIDTLWWLFLIVCSLVFAAVVIALGLALFRRGRTVVTTPADGEPQKVRIVVGATAVTAAILLVFLVASVSVSRATSGLPDPERRPVVVEVIGHQWWWEVIYDDAVPSRRFTTANEMRIPVGRPVIVRVATRDVIHSFWVPNLHGKIDLVPGRTNTIWFEADQPGVYRGQCAEFCGLQHAKMAFVVVAETDEAYERWAERQRQPALEPLDEAGLRGREVFLSHQCSLCHAIRGTGAWGLVAPDLTHIGSRLTLAAGTLPNTRGHLGGWILDPQQVKPGNFMPPTNLSADDLQALLSYLERLE